MKILIVEDEKDLSQSICEYLANEQFACEQVFEYTTALEKISLYDYACIILDIGLPDGSGVELMRQLKAKCGLRGIALSGYGMEEDLQKSREAGFERHVTKPVSLQTLQAALQETLEPA